MLSGDTSHDGIHGRARLREAGTGRQAADDADPLDLTIEPKVVRTLQARVLVQWKPELDVGRAFRAEVAPEHLRRDADHHVRVAVDGDRAADDVRIGAQAILPEPMPDDHDSLGPRRL